MDMDIHSTENNVDHFLISTRENQLLIIFVDETEFSNGSITDEGAKLHSNGIL